MPQLYDIWMKNYPQPDVNVSEEWEMESKTLDEVAHLIDFMEREYADESWKGHRMYQAKFYSLPSERM